MPRKSTPWLKDADSKESKYPTHTGRIDTIQARQCDYHTGSHRCLHGTYASDRDFKAYCDFHQMILHDAPQAHGQELWDICRTEYTWMHKSRHRYSWMRPDGTYPDPPFWFQPLETVWSQLTGLPVPHSAIGDLP